MKKAIVGKDDVIEKVLIAVLAQGHVLLEDVPGTGKTTLATAFAKALGLDNKRIQFTPDTMHLDIVGFSAYDMQTGELQYKPGAIITTGRRDQPYVSKHRQRFWKQWRKNR